MNWGKGIYIFIGVFVISMLGIVFISFQQTNEMIEENYYERELEYQGVIDAKNNLSAYKGHIFLYDSADYILIVLPTEVSDKIQNGSAKFLKLDNEKYDHTILLTQPKSAISKEKIKPGYNQIKLYWENEGTTYFYEKEVNISR